MASDAWPRFLDRRALEMATVTLLWGGAVLALLGTLLGLVRFQEDWGHLIASAGLVLAIAAVGVGYPITTLRTVAQSATGGVEYDQLKRWARLKTASLLLNLLGLASAVILAFGLLVSFGIARANVNEDFLARGNLVLIASLVACQAVAYYQSLHTPLNRDRTGPHLMVVTLTLALAGLMALLAALLASGRGGNLSSASLGPEDITTLLLGAAATLTYALFMTRGLPSITVLASQEGASLSGGPPLTRARGVLLPALLAFALLLVVFLFFVLFGIGVVGILGEVAQSPVLLGVFVFLLLALVGSVLTAARLARNEEMVQPLFRKPRSAKERMQNRLIGFSILGMVALLVPGALAYLGYGSSLGIPSTAWIHFLCAAILLGLGPYGFWAAREHKRIRRLEERFPDFLRDIASSHKGGLTLNQAVTIAARGEYGPLTPEIRKMADQLSWNVPFSEALVRFSDRVQTPLVERAVSLILQANRSGGATTDVLLAAARDAREIKNLENDRRLSMSLYTIVIYITFFVFLGVAAVMYAQFVPQIVASNEAASGAPEALSGAAPGGGSGSINAAQFQLFYFLAAVVQGLGDGIVAGLMGNGKAVLGLKHSFLMVLISYVTFTLFLV